nr:hypothetical protein [Tanacetum cinerariifolium]
MAKSKNEVYDDSLCSTSCKKNTDSLNTKITNLNEALSDSKTNLYHYKLALSQVEARLVEFKTQEIKFCAKIRGLEFNVKNKNIKIENLMNELEQIKKEKDGLDSKLTGFESAPKDLDTLLGSQRSNKNKEGLGYSVVPPPSQVYYPPKKDMSWTGLPEFADDTITDYSSARIWAEKIIGTVEIRVRVYGYYTNGPCGLVIIENLPFFYDDDDDEDCTIAITPDFPITNSLSMRDEHLDTIPATESDKFIKSSVENHIPIPSESEDKCECDVPDWDDSQTKKNSTFSNPLFDDSTSSDDKSSHEEDIHEMSFKTYSNPLFDLDEEIISSEFNPIHNEDLESTLKNDRFDTEPYLLESLLNRDTLMSSPSSPLKIDSLLAEFAGALIFLKSIPSRIDEADCGPEEDIHLVEKLLYDNSSPRPPEEIVSDNSNADIASFSPSPIPVEDSGSHMEEIDLPFTPDDPMPPGIKDDDYDSGRDILILEEFLDNYSLSLPANESYHFDIPLSYRPPTKPPDGNTGTLNIKMIGDVSDQKIPMPGLTITKHSSLGCSSFPFLSPLINSSMGGISHEEDIHEMSFRTYSNPLFNLDEEIISSEFNPIHNEDLESTLKNDRFDTEPYLIESLLNRDTLMSSPLKIDSLLAEFTGALIFLKSIPPRIDEGDCGPEEDIHLVERLFGSHMEEINLPFTPDDPMPPGIEDDDYDSGRDILILKELLGNYSFSLLVNESYHFDIPSPYRPPAKPPYGNTRTLNIKMMGDVSDQKVPIPGLTITRIINQEKSLDLLSHQGLEIFQPSAECPTIINGKNIPLLDVLINSSMGGIRSSSAT